MDFVKKLINILKLDKSIEESRKKDLELFLQEYKSLTEKYKFDFKAIVRYTQEGIVASFTIIDLSKKDETSRDNKSNK